MKRWKLVHGDCLGWLKSQPDNSVDLVIGSPPYEAARTYGIGFRLRGQEWVDWMVARMLEMVRVSRGLVAMVVEGQTRNYRWSAVPALLMADLHRAGICLRKPPAFHRVGIPGSGGKDWLRNDYEFIVCCGVCGRLPWSDNTAMGHPPKWAPGGAMSHRLSDGTRRNQWGGAANGKSNRTRDRHGNFSPASAHPSHIATTKADESYLPPKLANPGNVIKCKVGGGQMGSKLAHENEAPFPESLAEFFIRSFCPPSGIVLDPFCGSGTALAVALRHDRHAIGVDVRRSQIKLSRRRIAEVFSLAT